MNTLDYESFLELLPRGDELCAESLPTGLSYVEERNPRFVEPSLRPKIESKQGETSIVILSAPGAVGKSTLAAEIAARKGATLWDLSTIQVGSKTYAGTIMEAWGFQATGVQKRIQDGRFLFVLDALDEAQVRAGSQNFDAFLSDLIDAHRQVRAKPTVVLLARLDTADWIDLMFEDGNVPYARYEIEYFEQKSANEFLNKRLDSLRELDGGPRVHRQQVKPFEKARDALFNLVYSLFEVEGDNPWSQPRVRNFLGYAPVLEAFADYLDVGNYKALKEELESSAGAASDPWEFLNDVVSRLLSREEGKIQQQVPHRIKSNLKESVWTDWASLYKPSEQCERLLGRVLSTAPPLDSLRLPPQLASAYEDALESILPQHPFLSGSNFANVVFREFVYAWGLVSSHGRLADALRAKIRSPEDPFLPSHLFGRFLIEQSGQDDGVLEGEDFGPLYESFSSHGDGASLSMFQTGDSVQVALALGDEDELSTQLLNTSGYGIHVWRRIQNADIEIEEDLKLGLPGQRFQLGPSSDIRCRKLILATEEVDVDASNGIVIAAESYVGEVHPTKLKVRNESQGSLRASWPGIAHPWASYRAELPRPGLELSDTLKGDTLRRFLLMFRRQRTRKERTLHNTRWADDQQELRDELVEQALEMGVLSRIHKGFVFNSRFDSLKKLVGEPSEKLSAEALSFLREFLGDAQVERLLTEE